METKTIKELKKGAYFQRINSKTVIVRGAYVRELGKY